MIQGYQRHARTHIRSQVRLMFALVQFCCLQACRNPMKYRTVTTVANRVATYVKATNASSRTSVHKVCTVSYCMAYVNERLTARSTSFADLGSSRCAVVTRRVSYLHVQSVLHFCRAMARAHVVWFTCQCCIHGALVQHAPLDTDKDHARILFRP